MSRAGETGPRRPISGRTVVLGLGNPVLSDDRAGLAVAAEVARLLHQESIPGVDVLASTRAGFELIELLRDYAGAIIVDALDHPDPVPGRVRRLSLEDVSGSARLVGCHEINLATALALAEEMGVPMPEEVEVLGIEVRDAHTLNESLTPEVQGVIGPLAMEIYEELKRRAPVEEPADGPDFQCRRALYSPDAW